MDFFTKFTLIFFGASFVVFFLLIGYTDLGPLFNYKEARKFNPVIALLVRIFCSIISAVLASIAGLIGYGI